MASHFWAGVLHVSPSTPGVDPPGFEVTFLTASARAEKSSVTLSLSTLARWCSPLIHALAIASCRILTRLSHLLHTIE